MRIAHWVHWSQTLSLCILFWLACNSRMGGKLNVSWNWFICFLIPFNALTDDWAIERSRGLRSLSGPGSGMNRSILGKEDQFNKNWAVFTGSCGSTQPFTPHGKIKWVPVVCLIWSWIILNEWGSGATDRALDLAINRSWVQILLGTKAA